MEWPSNMRIVNDLAEVPLVQGQEEGRGGPRYTYIKKSKLQMKARENRHQIMNEICNEKGIPLLLTGHHLEDDLTGFFYRFSRRSGLEGLASQKPYSSLPIFSRGSFLQNILLGHPLLQIPKARLLATCEANGYSDWITDLGNSDADFMRNLIRQTLIKMQELNPEKLSTPALKGMLYRIKEAQEESRLQIKYIIENCTLLGNIPLKASAKTALASSDVSIKSLVSILGENNSIGGYEGPSRTSFESSLRSTLENSMTGLTHQSGDVMLIIPTRPGYRHYFFSPHTTSKAMLYLSQYVRNTSTPIGFYNAYMYATLLKASAGIRLARDRKMFRLNSSVQSFHLPTFENNVVHSNNDSHNNDARDFSSPCNDSTNTVAGNNNPVPPATQMAISTEQYRRLPFLTVSGLHGCLIRPLNSVDTYFRHQFYQRLNAPLFDLESTTSSNSKRRIFKRDLPVGPALLITHEVTNEKFNRSFKYDFLMKPKHFYSFDSRLTLRLVYPSLIEFGSAREASLHTEESLKDQESAATQEAIRRYKCYMEDDIQEWILPYSSHSAKEQRSKEKKEDKIENKLSVDSSEDNPNQTKNTLTNVSGFLPSLEFKQRGTVDMQPYLLPIYEEILYSNYKNSVPTSPDPGNDPDFNLQEVDEESLDDIQIVVSEDEETVSDNFSENSSIKPGRREPTNIVDKKSLLKNVPKNSEHVSVESTVTQPPSNFSLEEMNKPRTFRLCLVTLEALRYMALIAHKTGQLSVLSDLELFRQSYPVEVYGAFPLLLEPETGYITIPTHGISLKPYKNPRNLEAPIIQSFAKGNGHLFNKIFSPAFFSNEPVN